MLRFGSRACATCKRWGGDVDAKDFRTSLVDGVGRWQRGRWV